ncbi:MAG TPA: hypothetical protein VIV54_03220 [Burkholderiales bacterium]
MPTVYARTLRRAAEILGGDQMLATTLQVTPTNLALWLAGHERPPTNVFLAAVDLISEHDIAKIRPPG